MQLERMTDNQMKTFIQMAQTGVACGLMHPFEWLYNAVRMQSFMPYAEQPAAEEQIVDAFLAFWRGTDSQPDDPCTTITKDELIDMINKWYARGSKQDVSSPEQPPA